MATSYRSTIEVNVWKEHTCAGCGSTFRYLFKRKKTGQGGTPDAASEAARAAVVQALANEVDMQPCPGCGMYQPDMVGSRRARRHWWLVGITFAVLLVLLILGAADMVPFSLAAWMATGLCGLLVLGHLLVDLRNPNADLDDNHRLAQARVEKGDLWVPSSDRQGAAAPDTVESGWSSAHRIAYVMLGLGVLALASSQLLRTASGWPANPDWFPEVAGPGDEVYVYFPQSISSIKGYWSGQATALVVNAAEVGLPTPQLTASSQQSTWGNTISAKSSEKYSRSRLWARVKLPPAGDLAGKTLQIKMNLGVSYPTMKGGGFENQQQPFSHTADLRLAAANAGGRYRAWWWGGLLGGAVLVLLPGILLAKLADAFRQRALPTNIFVPGQEEGAGPDKEGADDRVRE
jgi:hypothetical protein